MTPSSQNITETSSTTNHSISTEGFDQLAIVQLMCFPIITAAGLVGNVLICFAVCKRRRLRITDVFILNLAATDLGTCIISIPFDFAEILSKQWPFGNILCKTVYPLQTILMAVSVYTLLFMSWERHRSVMPPLKPKLKAKRALAILFFLWVACISLVGPYIATLRVETDGNGKTECREQWPGTYSKVFTLVVFIVLYVLPLFVITANYIKISQKLWRDIQRMRKAIEGDNKGTVKKPLTQARAQRNMRIVKIFIIVVIAFSLCMLPNHIMWIWYDFGSGPDYQHSFDTIIVFCYILVYANSAINPFIFVFLHRRYCKDIFSSCSSLKTLASCLKAEPETNETMKEVPRMLHKQVRRKKKIASYAKKPGPSSKDLYKERKEFWDNYWRQELIPKCEASGIDRVFQLSKKGRVDSSLGKVPEEDNNNCDDDDDNFTPQATRKGRVNFGEVVHIDEQKVSTA